MDELTIICNVNTAAALLSLAMMVVLLRRNK